MKAIQVFLLALMLSLSTHGHAGIMDLFCIESEGSSDSCSEETAEPVNVSSVQPLLETKQKLDEVCVVVTGSAPTKDVDEGFARKMAIRDGLQQASLKNNATIKTDQSVEDYQLKLNNTRITSHSKIKSFSVLEEGYEDPEDIYGKAKQKPLNYEVKLDVCLTEERGVCTNLPGNHYQTRLAVAPVVFPHAQQARDVSNLINGYQLELERRFRNQGYRNYVLLNETIELQPNIQVKPNLNRDQLRAVRDKTGAQYLLLTAIRSMSSHTERNDLKNSIKSFYNFEVKADSRYIEVDWYVVDLMTHELVHQARGGFDVQGDVYVGRDRPFGSNAFFATNTGKVFHALLEQQVNNSIDFLHCKPYQSEIIDVRGDEYIVYLNANSGAKVGDDLAVYHKTGRPVRFGGNNFGSDFQPGAFLKITRIMPKFAVAELTAKKNRVQIGDVVKVW